MSSLKRCLRFGLSRFGTSWVHKKTKKIAGSYPIRKNPASSPTLSPHVPAWLAASIEVRKEERKWSRVWLEACDMTSVGAAQVRSLFIGTFICQLRTKVSRALLILPYALLLLQWGTYGTCMNNLVYSKIFGLAYVFLTLLIHVPMLQSSDSLALTTRHSLRCTTTNFNINYY